MEIEELTRYLATPLSSAAKGTLKRMQEYLVSEYRTDLLYLFEETNITEDLFLQHVDNELSFKEIVDMYMRELFDMQSSCYAATL